MLTVDIWVESDNPKGNAKIARRALRTCAAEDKVSTDIVRAALKDGYTDIKVRVYSDAVKIHLTTPARILKNIPSHQDIVDVAKDLLVLTYMSDLFEKRRKIGYELRDVLIKIADGSTHVINDRLTLQKTAHAI